MSTLIQFQVLPYISPNYKGNQYLSVRKIIKQWMKVQFKKEPTKIFVNMEQDDGYVVFDETTDHIKDIVKMISEHPMGQLFFSWDQTLKNRQSDPYNRRKSKFLLPYINYPYRFFECRNQAAIDSEYLDILDFEEEGILASMLLEISLLEANEGLEEIDILLDQFEDQIPIQETKKEEEHPLVVEFSDDEDSEDEDEEIPVETDKESKILAEKMKKDDGLIIQKLVIHQKDLLAWMLNE